MKNMADSCDIWQKPTKFFKAIILQLKNKYNQSKKKPITKGEKRKDILYSTENIANIS